MEVDKKICPICGKKNHCGQEHGAPEGNCWCRYIRIPQELIELVSEDLKGKSCICRDCINEPRISIPLNLFYQI